MKYSYQELAVMRQKSSDFEKKARDRRNKLIEQADKDIKDFISYMRNETRDSELYKAFRNAIFEGMKPSEAIEKYLGGLFNGIIFPRRKACLLYAADNCHKWAYESRHIGRRSFHTKDAGGALGNIERFLYDFINCDNVNRDFTDILRYNVTEEEKAYIISSHSTLKPFEIAYEIDCGNKEFIEEIKNIINGDSEADISREIILGVMQSGNAGLHRLMGKLLLAARLQEGLRQAICENADMGTVEAFIETVKVIHENNLIRFSSVKRAIGVWTGIVGYEYESRSSDLERIANKTEELIYNALMDEKYREEYLNTEDSMKIYIALWAYGVYETNDTLTRIKQLSESGTHHQILTAGYAVNNFCSNHFRNKAAKYIFEKHTEQDILAVYMPSFMPDPVNNTFNIINHGDYSSKLSYTERAKCHLYDYFSDKAEAEKYYCILMNILKGLKGKAVEFSPCVFPWYAARLSKNDIAVRLMWIAGALDDDEKIDEVLDYLSDVESARSRFIHLLLTAPRTEKQKRVLTERVCDKESYARTEAYRIICHVDISDENYLLLEDMLRFKNAQMRSNIIYLFMKQNDSKLYDGIERLILDKKEEKRTAALDMILQLKKDDKRTGLYEKCRELTAKTAFATSKEKILAEQIVPAEVVEEAAPPPLYDENACYTPNIDRAYIEKAKAVFDKYFYHKGIIDKLRGKKQDFDVINEKLLKLSEEHSTDEFINHNGETVTLSSGFLCLGRDDNYNITISLSKLWDEFYEKEIGSPVLALRAYMAFIADADNNDAVEKSKLIIKKLLGEEFTHAKAAGNREKTNIVTVYKYYYEKYLDKEDLRLMAAYIAYALSKEDIGLNIIFRFYDGTTHEDVACVLFCNQLQVLLSPLCTEKSDFKTLFAIRYALEHAKGYTLKNRDIFNRHFYYFNNEYHPLDSADYVRAAFVGAISEDFLFKTFTEQLRSKDNRGSDALQLLSCVALTAIGIDSPMFIKNRFLRSSHIVGQLIGEDKPEDYDEQDKELLRYAYGIYEKLIKTVLYEELRRGDSETQYSKFIFSINRIYGIEYYVKILTALGRETLNRSGYYYYGSDYSKRSCLSHLLSVCVPNPDDNAEKLRSLISGTDITEERLIEAAIYSPEWLDITEEYLGWQGFKSACYYFMAHMNETFDDKRKAVITKYTPISITDLHNGAFDVNWFNTAYEMLGAKRFDVIYKAAKYISDGAKHTRARKYADAALGKTVPAEVKKQVAEKRNKDLLMAYAIIPVTDDKDMLERYLYLQQFLKESKRFGSQRSASEKLAVEMAMKNLATTAGYTDVTRLKLRMETRLVEENICLSEEKQIGDVTVRLSINENGKSEIICTKDGKQLKSIPAKLKKDEYIVRLNEVKKSFNDQYSRTRQMFEQSMEDGTEYTFAELKMLLDNPVVMPIIKNLVYICGEKSGYLSENGIVDYNGELTAVSDNDAVKIAHPYNLYAEKSWTEYQRDLFEKGIVQPFRQVFRELYVKTDEELVMKYSLRYAGNQIQPQKTVACLKTRRWTADVEDGLQKVYYKENITARIFSRADWFTPSDIEMPTLEWVEFSDRLTGCLLEIKDVPDVIFSEVMRDVDLAVSVAHAGGVDPETSHSTIEMRAALLSFTLPLFRLTNVEIKGSHAHIAGERADYTLHLGSGVIHQKGGAMISILPVHSQHRGKLFLPFADDDPKTAEIISKVLFLAEDNKIKDPTVLSQINR